MDNNTNFNNVQFDPMTGQPINQQSQQTIPSQNINMYSQQSQQGYSSVNTSQQHVTSVQQSTKNTFQQPKEPQQPKKKVNPKLLIVLAILVVVIIVGIIFVPKLFLTKENLSIEESLTYSNSFWINNDEGLYALFNIDGKQLTEFDFKDVSSDFVNGTLVVKNKNDEYGLISSNGKMIIEFGKYNYIFNHEVVYEMVDNEYNDYLYNSSGKLVRKLDKEREENVDSIEDNSMYALLESNIDYKIIDYNGKEILTIAKAEGKSDKDKPIGNNKGNYASIFYNNITYVIDISKGKVLLTIPDSRHFCISEVNEKNPNEFILETCSIYYSSEDIKDGFKVVRNGKVAYSKEIDNYAKFEGNNVVYGNDSTYLLDDKGNEKTNLKYNAGYKDYKNYIKISSTDDAELYVNGELKETFECSKIESGYAEHGVYLLDYCSGFGNGNKIYVNADGTRINDKSYKKATKFDSNGYASVTEDGEKFYLINLKGEKVSDYYSKGSPGSDGIYNVNGTKNLYYGANEDGTKTIFEVNGKKILTGNIIFPMYTIKVDGNFIILKKNNKYVVYNLIKRKEIVTLDSKPDIHSIYFTTSENSKIQYYSYTTGKLFYEK